MDLTPEADGASHELFQAQSHLYKHIFNFINSMALKCAVELGIPDIIHTHNPPVTLSQLVSALHLPPAKTSYVHRLMRVLVHSGFFAIAKLHENQDDKEEEEEEEGYVLTPSSRLLLSKDKDNVPNLSAFVLGMLDPVLVTPWHFLGGWFRGINGGLTAFDTAHGKSFWEYGSHDREFFNLFNEAMASDSRMMSLVTKDCRPVFEGLGSLVDLGGGKGLIANIISEAFPQLECTVFDLPHVVANIPDTRNLKYVGGDMFQSVPSADAILLKVLISFSFSFSSSGGW